MRRTLILLALPLAAWAMIAGFAKGSSAEPDAKPHPGLEMIKSLEGTWRLVDEETAKAGDTTLTYRVTAAGSAVIETLFVGTPHEMVTVYHADGDALMLTHYCALANQPRMRATPKDPTKQIDFKYSGGTNVDADKDQHMHNLTLTFVDKTHMRQTWTSYNEGKAADLETFDWVRAPQS